MNTAISSDESPRQAFGSEIMQRRLVGRCGVLSRLAPVAVVGVCTR
jgi:hypothetical protein